LSTNCKFSAGDRRRSSDKLVKNSEKTKPNINKSHEGKNKSKNRTTAISNKLNEKGSKAKSKEIIGKQIKQITQGKLKREPRPGANN